jgi:hypothetical protein
MRSVSPRTLEGNLARLALVALVSAIEIATTGVDENECSGFVD